MNPLYEEKHYFLDFYTRIIVFLTQIQIRNLIFKSLFLLQYKLQYYDIRESYCINI